MWQVFTKICAKEAKCDGCGDLVCTLRNMFNLLKAFGLYLRYFKKYFKVLGIISYRIDTLLQVCTQYRIEIKISLSPITTTLVASQNIHTIPAEIHYQQLWNVIIIVVIVNEPGQ